VAAGLAFAQDDDFSKPGKKDTKFIKHN